MKLGKVLRSLALVGLVSVFVFPGPSQAKAGLGEGADKALTRELDQLIGDTGTKVPGLGVIVFKDGREVYSHFAGHRYFAQKAGEKDLPVIRDTRFRAASVSKLFTGFTILQLVDQGKLSLDEDVSKPLGFTLRNPAYPDRPITVRMLLSHTSSLRDGELYAIPPDISVREFFVPDGRYWEEGAHFAPEGQAPGEYFKYANINYGLLGTIIEKVTGQRFDLYQKSHILKELDIRADYKVGGLTPEGFRNLGTIYQKNQEGHWEETLPWIAQIDDYRGKQPPAEEIRVENPDHRSLDAFYDLKDYKPGTNATIFSPQGGLRISYEELSHALALLVNKGRYKDRQVVRKDLLQEMMKPQWVYDAQKENGDTYDGAIETYGLGLYRILGNSTSRVCKDHEIDLVGHTGEAYGLLSGLFVVPGTRDGFLYMMNGEAVEEDEDPRSAGAYSGNYRWEELIMNAICEHGFIEK